MTPFTLLVQDLPAAHDKAPVKLLSFDGELDETNIEEHSPKIYKLIDDGGKHVVLIFDLEGLKYMNSKAIGYMTDWSDKVKAKGGYIAVINIPANIRDLFETIGIAKLFREFDTLDNAKRFIYR